MRTLVTAEQSVCEKLDEMDIDKAIAYLQKIKEENKGKNLIFVLDCTSDIYGTTELNLYSEQFINLFKNPAECGIFY